MRQFLIITALLVMSNICTWGQPQYNYKELQMERLDRGVVAVKQSDGRVFVTWRILRSDQRGEAFSILRNGELLTPQPLTEGGAYFIDEHPLTHGDATYEVRGGGVNGTYTLSSEAPIGYISVPLQKPDSGRTPDGRTYTYSANDASVADVDGDGQYEIILKWEPSNAHDNSHPGYTGPTIIDCYRLSGERLWRINLGPNIRSGAHYTPFVVYDFDGDGRAELMVKTADGTIDGKNQIIGDSVVDYREIAQQENEPQRPNYGRRSGAQRQGRNIKPTTGRILRGPEYITVFNGITGAAMDTKPYIPERGEVASWGDNYGNRSERYLAAVAYLDGHRASAIFCRGYYTRTVIAAWDWDGHTLTEHWIFDTNNPEWASYAGQGNHNLRVADVDGDGCDEITYGSMAVDHDGQGLYNTGFGHGDAIHLMAFDPHSNNLQVWDCHENKRDGSDFRNARTGEVIFQIKSHTDVGRAMAADIDPTNLGVEMWSTDSHGIRNLKGEVVHSAQDADDPQHDNNLVMNGRYLPVNYGIWWDGDLLRELLDHETVYKYNWKERSIDTVAHFDGIVFNNGSKSNPCLQADLLGDWREEVMARDRESTHLRIYVSTHPTTYRITCLMQDVPYRLSVAYQNVGYNQPPETGFYLGAERTDYEK